MCTKKCKCGLLLLVLCVAAVTVFYLINSSGKEASQAFEGTLVKAGKMILV